MKKHLIAAAVAAAVAAPAMAQNVTIGGVLDQGFLSRSNANAAGDSNLSMGGNHTTPNWRITGSEDLGGGMRASFHLESTMAPQIGRSGAGTTNASGTALTDASTSSQKFFDRAAWVGLSQGALGVQIGRQNNLLAGVAGVVDPQMFTFTGYGPNVTIMAMGAIPQSQFYATTSQAISTAGTGTTALTAATSRDLFRIDNATRLNYAVGGWNLSGFYAAGAVTGDAGLGATRAVSASGKIGAASVAAGYNETAATAAGNGELRGYLAGLSMPLGSMTLRVSTGEQQGNATTGTYKVNGFGLVIPTSAAANVNLTYFDVNLTHSSAASAGGYAQFGAIYNYNLSKRTGLYAAVFNRDFKGGESVFRASTLPMSDTSYAAGMRHAF